MENLKNSKLYLGIVIIVILAGMGISVQWLPFTISIQPRFASSPPEKIITPDLPKVKETANPTPKIPSSMGTLRISNQSQYPIRLVLLSRHSGAKSQGKPAHWNFAPGEGGNQGVILSLPDGKVLLENGDVLVAFAQDGSRRYWGPYLLGETQMPIWSAQVTEWQLVLY